jgi:Tol biopolymer transport system component
MKRTCRIARVAALMYAALLHAQNEERAKATAAAKTQHNAQILEANARTLTIFDRQGKVVTTVGPPALYNQPVFSPDGKRLVVSKTDLNKENIDLWVFEIATGKSIQLTSGQSREASQSPAWSPDGSRLAYVALRGGSYGLYEKPSDGQGPEELMQKLPSATSITDWSMDGRHILIDGRLSPDDRFVAFASNASGKSEIYVRPYDRAASAGQQWQVSDQGGQGMAFWRRDGKELYYLAPDRGIMAVPVSTSPTFEAGKPKLLFRPAEDVAVSIDAANVSRDGELFVIAVPPSPLRQITILDRRGIVVKTVGRPGVYIEPGFSPDGTRISVTRTDPKTGNLDIWTFDVATGKGYAVTNDVWPDTSPIWSADGKHIAYVSRREQYSGIYRKAWDGSGEEELLFRYTPGATIGFSDWSPDGKFLTFSTGVLLVVPLRQNEKPPDRKAIEWMREEYDADGGRFSPDMRFLAYASDELNSQSQEVYVRPFDASKPEAPPAGPIVQVSKNGALEFMWRKQDGKEMYLLNRDWEMTAVDVATTPTFQVLAGPKVLFKLPGPMVESSPEGVSRDGQRFVFGMPVKATQSLR